MKNQYFGDIRDLFKYDLIQKIMEQCPTLRQFAFIPMLTANDDRTDGNRRVIDDTRMQGRPGSENNELKTFLRKFDAVSSKERDFREIQNYFSGAGIQTEIYDPTPRYFENREREKYFSNIPGTILDSALVFVDPDNGLEVQTSSRKHILYDDVNTLFDRIRDDSLLMIYQHFPREDHDKYIKRRVQELCNETSVKPLWITDNDIVFFFLPKGDGIHAQLERVLTTYSGRYEKCQSPYL